MYKNFKPIRNPGGKIVKAAPYQDKLRPGTVARVQPDRRWFGNTRVVGQEALQKFQANLGKVLQDPFQVVLKKSKLPVTLLREKAKNARVHILDTQPYRYAFGPKSTRKLPVTAAGTVEELASGVAAKASKYRAEEDRDLVKEEEMRDENPNPLFRAGQSHRVWGELFKVIDSSDVVVAVLDARDPAGTRCRHVEEFLRKEKPHKHLIFVLNKVDLVPTSVTKVLSSSEQSLPSHTPWLPSRAGSRRSRRSTQPSPSTLPSSTASARETSSVSCDSLPNYTSSIDRSASASSDTQTSASPASSIHCAPRKSARSDQHPHVCNSTAHQCLKEKVRVKDLRWHRSRVRRRCGST